MGRTMLPDGWCSMARKMLPDGWRSKAQKIFPVAWFSMARLCPGSWPSMGLKSLPETWRASDRLRRALTYLRSRSTELAWVIILFLACELLIWGIYAGLQPAGLQFLSSIVSMVVVFLGMLLLGWLVPRSEALYTEYVRSKVDFINQNLGVGFPVPMIMFTNKEHIQKVGPMFGNFFATLGVFWTSMLLITWAVMLPILKTPKNQNSTDLEEGRRDETKLTSTTTSTASSCPSTIIPQQSRPPSRAPTLAGTTDSEPPKEGSEPSSAATSITAVDLQPSPPSPLRAWTPVLLATLLALSLGLPISYAAHEDRPLDFSILWLSWAASVKAQATLRRHPIPKLPDDIRRILATFLNPVLLTTFIMTAHTRIKASVRGVDVDIVLETFSSGTPLAELWSGTALDKSFGAGDAALSLLEVGIVVWGFKLHECRRQLFSLSGLSVVLASLFSAAFSAFVSIAMARSMSIGSRESLSFAARSTTLALSKPSTTALGGSVMVNACLVVGNGIFGQLIAPWLLRGFRVRDRCDDTRDERNEGGCEDGDSAVEVAMGAAVGMNGAAMGVSYLYERRSRAAPYAALSMTAFGVATTVLASVGPFQDALRKVASI